MTFLFQRNAQGRLSVEEFQAPQTSTSSPSTLDEVSLLAGPDGKTTLTIRKGDRVAWEDPAGLGGVTLYGTVVRIGSFAYAPGEISVFAIDAEPSEELRAMAAWIRESLAGIGPRPTCGLDGNGGLTFFTGEGVRWAARAGKLRLASIEVGAKGTP